ncbi:MAG: hypothetical protein ABIH76_08875 [Candidatus Bathyarchaeota archaeon]
MKAISKISIMLIVMIVVLLTACSVKDNNSQVDVQPEECSGYLTHDRRCVDECPEGFESIASTAYESIPACVIEGYFSEERYILETKCSQDSDCLWDEYETGSCCPYIPKIVNVKTHNDNLKWRQENCRGDMNFSEWKWRLCPNNPYRNNYFNQSWKPETPFCWEGKKCVFQE